MLGRYRGNLAEMTLDFENMFSAVELRLRKDSFALEPIKVKQVICRETTVKFWQDRSRW